MLNFKETIVYNVRDLSIHISHYIKNNDEEKVGENVFATHGSERISRLQGMTAGFLYTHQDGQVIQKDLEKAMSISKSTASGLVHRMVKNGLIYTTPSPDDARVKCLNLTTYAKNAMEAINAQAENTEEVLKQGISPEDLATFFKVIDQIRKNTK
ncbi:MarR family winged helix-turn-helix transcriptional regulator [Companilactobacillus sp. HBUAS56275]|uniref:MarR family transcriptional regulator n=1 Tax=Candidatus Companilactobacillus pullicola TaxID=2838523 RepID=A0A9D2CMZ8_9LACO|nr:MarR family transcriptional regulator [Candidatus Companilactobacillus pullicola]